MKVKIPVSIVPKCGQLYAHWRSDEIISTEKGKEVKKQYFEPTQVPLPPPGASDQDVKAAWKLARDAGEYMWELTSERRPPAALQQVKLKEFALRSAKVDKHCIREFIPLWLIDYATSPTKKGGLPLVAAVWNMADTWDGVLEKLGPERELHASSIESTKLQSIVDHLPGDQARHAVNVRCAYKYGVKKGKILKGQNPADDIETKGVESFSRVPFTKETIQRGLLHMGTLLHGDQWQLLTLNGVYTPMRFITACRLQRKPKDFVRPETRRACAFLDTSNKDWRIEYFDTKGGQWETQILDESFVKWWLKPYIDKNGFAEGEYLFPNFARHTHAPSLRWQDIMEASGCEMVYSKNGTCRTGYHALRMSLDKWQKENLGATLSTQDIEEGTSRHGSKVHRDHYNSGAVNVAEQRRINQSRPKFLPIDCDLAMSLMELRENIQRHQVELKGMELQEKELLSVINKSPNNEHQTH